MDTHITFLAPIFIIFFLSTLSQFYCQEEDGYSICSRPYNCGNITNISYPFFGGNRRPLCGSDGFELECWSNQTTSIKIGENRFTVLDINQTAYTMRIRREDLVYNGCEFSNTSINTTLFRYLYTVENLTIFTGCDASYSIGQNNYTCPSQSENLVFYVNETQLGQFSDLENHCKIRFQVPVLRDIYLEPEGGDDVLRKALEEGFDVDYFAVWPKCRECMGSKGICGSRLDNASQFSCHCGDGASEESFCLIRSNHPLNWKRKVALGVVAALVGALSIGIAFCVYMGRKKNPCAILHQQYWNMKSNDQDIEAFIRNHGALALRRYKFSDVKKMTNSFKVKLGQGGFGAVYKGKLITGSPVAVKILNASKGNGQEFINEVASISMTSHVNVVALLGFCFEGRKKALIYEFMANGSLEKFIFKKTDDGACLSWENLYQIAIGIARGLEYLHRGCSTRIFHFDIKPHNILLDENFCPKISDFGLAKLCVTRESVISMSDARGTLGYIAPEVWNRNFGGVSHKSDVYSYGMMLLEMVGGRKNINAEASQISEIYFPDWIYKKLELGLGLDGVKSSEENNIAKRMTLVGLWCIQTIPSHRPTMSRVIEMLEGSLDSLEMPPKPVLCSPTRSTPESSTT